jgi:asparagine synthase (glutamine-hydrolysing)
MCGICGKINFDPSRHIEPSLIKQMMDVISHRGPDDDGMYIKGQIGLGHKRLSIIDLDTGKQPISDEDGQVWIVYNGEIYNHKELQSELKDRGHIFKTNTDTEVIVHLYEDYGERCLARLRGMFAFALYDERKNKLFLARDRMGIKPLYYTVTKDSFLFASEIKSIIQDPVVENRVNLNGLYSFLSYTYTPGPETVFDNIFKLQPGHYLTIEHGKIFIKEYWDLNEYYLSSDNGLKGESLREYLINILKESVRLHMISDVPVGFLLSGGVDSTATLSFATEQINNGLKTFTVGFEGQDFEDEREYARKAAKQYGVEHFETTITAVDFFEFLPQYIWFMEEPIFEPPAVSLYYVSKLAKDHVKVLISGEGGDEAFAGYQTYRNLVWLERIKRILGFVRKDVSYFANKAGNVFHTEKTNKYAPLLNIPLETYYYSRASTPTSVFNSNMNSLYSKSFLNEINSDLESRPFYKYFKNCSNMSELKKMLYVDSKTWLPDRLLVKADKMTMANSIELRVPLLDHKVLEFAAGLPDRQKLRGFTTKYIFKKILENRIPCEIINRKKAGFPIPYAHWLHKNKQVVLDVLSDLNTNKRGYFNTKAIQRLIFDEWVKNGKYATEIFNLFTLELWHRRFIDKTSA